MDTLSNRQQAVYDYICHFQSTEGYPPTYQDIAKAFNFSSTATVRTYLEYLEKKGYIERFGKARGIKIKNTTHSQTPIAGDRRRYCVSWLCNSMLRRIKYN